MNYFKISKINFEVTVFILFLILSDYFWLTLSRIIDSDDFFYFKFPISHSSIIYSILFGILIIISSFFITFLIPSNIKFNVNLKKIHAIILCAIILNLIHFFVFDRSIRYEHGALTGGLGIIHYFSMSINLFISVILIRCSRGASSVNSINKIIFYLFFVAWFLVVDGLASSLTIFVVLILCNPYLSLSKLIYFALTAFFLMLIGFYGKWGGDLPDYLNFSYFVKWIVSRFSIQSESMMAYLNGYSLANNFFDAVEFNLNSIFLRFKIIFGQDYYYNGPKTISEMIFYDMHHEFGSGSSPGFFFGMILHGFFYIIPLFFIIIQLCYFLKNLYIGNRVIFYVAFSFFLKELLANPFELWTVISPSLVSYLLIFFGSTINVKE